jgi:hypothetical protein
MAIYAKDIVNQAKAWLGKKESNGGHKVIIDTYNANLPLPRGYKVKYTDAWCATFVSAVAIKCGATSIIPKECSCEKMIALFKGLGCWQENDSYRPKAGDIIFYDWEDSGSGDTVGAANHVGIVEVVSGATITVIEGNKNNAVERRNIAVNGRYIRGYGLPKYSTETATAPAVAKVDNTADKYAAEAVNWAIKEGIVSGDENGNLKLHSNITKQDALVLLYRAFSKLV